MTLCGDTRRKSTRTSILVHSPAAKSTQRVSRGTRWDRVGARLRVPRVTVKRDWKRREAILRGDGRYVQHRTRRTAHSLPLDYDTTAATDDHSHVLRQRMKRLEHSGPAEMCSTLFRADTLRRYIGTFVQ